MDTIYNFLLANIYLYICILIVLVIIATILFIIASNQRNRKKIKDDYVEAERVEAELEKIEDSPKLSELEDILKKMQEDIDLKPEDVVKKFEEEQEEKAIISYQELVDNVKSGKIEVIDDEQSDVNFVESLEIDLTEEPIISTVEDEESSVTPEMVKEVIQTINDSSVKEEPKKFKNSEFISPIYGVMENNLEYPTVKKSETVLDIMNTKDYNELTEEIKKQEEFLNALKAFRNNL
ncbi:MAG: hypothetical protein IJE04_03210 [Bacilli bacterium]|nr:hypothetical protein [Bacilli bacterium]